MPNTCWEALCGQDCFYCRYKQERYRLGFNKPCFEWFREKKIEKKCKTCSYYLQLRTQDASLPEDPSFHLSGPSP